MNSVRWSHEHPTEPSEPNVVAQPSVDQMFSISSQ